MPQQLATQYAPTAGHSICHSSWPHNIPQQLATQYATAAGHSIYPSSWPLNMPHIPSSILQPVTKCKLTSVNSFPQYSALRYTANEHTLTKNSHAIKEASQPRIFASAHTGAPNSSQDSNVQQTWPISWPFRYHHRTPQLAREVHSHDATRDAVPNLLKGTRGRP